MSSAEESPAQRAARLRRERREAKIKEGGAARLDKITSLSGRTPQSIREETSPIPSPSPSPQPPAPVSMPETGPFPGPPPRQFPGPTASVEDHPPEDLQAQQEYIRSLLRQNGPPPTEPGLDDDPMKLLNTLMSGGIPGGIPGADPSAGGAGLSQANLAGTLGSLGLPPWAANWLGAAARPQTDEEKRDIRTWKVLHVVFAVAMGIYLLLVLGASVATFGSQPPPPATARNPFVLFTTAELLLGGTRIMLSNRGGGLVGPALWIQLFRDVIQDGSIVLFLLGMSAWWTRDWMAV
ncbi:uncharacterized protein ACLA_050190 [Aspergillus clavatus NRRL 1]|uniref:GET complex, subunit GET2 n=1 Tax=Aspergillus clavatus (strain ATCC 1007 / CBS 513.65 / DSM 816 / NCTC 3887 / NRRL 1 / QM 1276 / 107) TaxID=344612 RepID=A1CI42_ASPCL|nr:uncharacterized protein ACLA_050190 [Aspergillus clavatus NRRL 1]EAW10547.1 conserved hypothetical protein [Aspergillus clavatus NRRL 1]